MCLLAICLLAICMSSSEKYLSRASAHFLTGFFAFFKYWVVWAVYTFWIYKCLLVISFSNIISHSVGCLFILSIVSFTVQKFVSLIRCHLFIFSFIYFALGDRSKKCCNNLCQRVFCLCSFLGVSWFQVLHLGLWSMLILFFDMVWGNVLISFFYMFLSNFPRTTIF